ncbi:MAG TPA: PQQ-binding-like beta-propeller repeat protein [Rhodopila sp.]
MLGSPSRIVCLALWAAFLLNAGSVLAQAPPGSEDPNNWPQYHRTSNGWRYSPLDQVNTENVGRLHVAWINQAGDIAGGMQETPIVVDGVIYSISGSNRVAAIDAKTGKEIWHYETKLDPITGKAGMPPYSRGVTVGRGKVFIATYDGRAIALDQQTGKEAWSAQLDDFNKDCAGCYFTAPPVLINNVLTFGSAIGDLSARGKIFGVDSDSGRKLWTFEVIKKDSESWSDETVAKFGGGGVWIPGSYDPVSNTVFYGTGNPATMFWGEDRKGDNLYTDSIIALDPQTGKLKWYRQEIEHDLWDYDSTYESLLIDRGDKNLLVHLNKSGFVFVIDRQNGKIDNVWPLVETYTFAKEIDPKTGGLIGRNDLVPDKRFMFCPSAWGGRSWNHGAYNPKTGLWYTNVLELCMSGVPVEQKADPHGYAVGLYGAKDVEVTKVPGKPAGRLDARDPVTGERKWTYEADLPLLGSVLTTGGGLVFNGDPLGVVRAFDADNGNILWSFNTGSGLRSGIVSYTVDGKQYILVPSGRGSFAALIMPALFPQMADVPGAAALIAFTLD